MADVIAVVEAGRVHSGMREKEACMHDEEKKYKKRQRRTIEARAAFIAFHFNTKSQHLIHHFSKFSVVTDH